MAKTFPNPLQITIGTGIIVRSFHDEDGGCGVLFQTTPLEGKTGELAPNGLPAIPHRPQPGELYLRFPTAASAVVALEALTRVICDLMGFPGCSESKIR